MRPISPPARAALLASILILCAATCAAQTPQEGQAAAPPSGLALEIETKEGPAKHHSVPGQFFGGRYRRLPDWRPQAGGPQPRTFKVTNRPEGDGVRVKVFALMDRFHEEEILLGDYLLREGEKAAVEAMRGYGFEPMEITLVRVVREPSAPPAATSRVPSVAVVGVEERQPANFPSFKVALRNLSHKDITYLEIKTRSSVLWPRAERNLPLIKAGEVHEVNVFGAARGRSSNGVFTPAATDTIEVVTAVFADESYEGDQHSAITHIAALRGQKTQIERALALWGSAPGGEGEGAGVALDEFERRVQTLGRQAPPALVELLAAMPGVTPRDYEKLKVYVEGGLDFVRKELLKDIREYRQAAEGRRYAVWLGDLRKKYEDWLSRL